jgi:predicted enzyme related to lactoylglutathione lyase
MAERTSYAPGTPSWVDLGSPDPEVTNAFYQRLFGWRRDDAGPPGHTHGYGFYAKADKVVAGHRPASADQARWSTYISVVDAVTSAEHVVAHGGLVSVPPTDLLGHGTMAACVDPTGAPFSLWQPGDLGGVQLVDEPGTLCWAELATADVARALDFYVAVFGWTTTDGSGADEVEIGVDGRVVARARSLPADVPGPARWTPYFGTDDIGDSTILVTDLGGAVEDPPVDTPGVGQIARAAGPHGEHFGLVRLQG